MTASKAVEMSEGLVTSSFRARKFWDHLLVVGYGMWEMLTDLGVDVDALSIFTYLFRSILERQSLWFPRSSNSNITPINNLLNEMVAESSWSTSDQKDSRRHIDLMVTENIVFVKFEKRETADFLWIWINFLGNLEDI